MKLEVLKQEFCVCKLADFSQVNWEEPFVFPAKTDQEYSLVCEEHAVPENAAQIERGWKGMRIAGQLPFSMVGVLADLASVLAQEKISIFVVSTYDTDYLFVKKESLAAAVCRLSEEGHLISE